MCLAWTSLPRVALHAKLRQFQEIHWRINIINHSSLPRSLFIKKAWENSTTSEPFPHAFEASFLLLSNFSLPPGLSTFVSDISRWTILLLYSSLRHASKVWMSSQTKFYHHGRFRVLGGVTARRNHSLPNLWRSHKPLCCFPNLLRRKARQLGLSDHILDATYGFLGQMYMVGEGKVSFVLSIITFFRPWCKYNEGHGSSEVLCGYICPVFKRRSMFFLHCAHC